MSLYANGESQCDLFKSKNFNHSQIKTMSVGPSWPVEADGFVEVHEGKCLAWPAFSLTFQCVCSSSERRLQYFDCVVNLLGCCEVTTQVTKVPPKH